MCIGRSGEETEGKGWIGNGGEGRGGAEGSASSSSSLTPVLLGVAGKEGSEASMPSAAVGGGVVACFSSSLSSARFENLLGVEGKSALSTSRSSSTDVCPSWCSSLSASAAEAAGAGDETVDPGVGATPALKALEREAALKRAYLCLASNWNGRERGGDDDDSAGSGITCVGNRHV